MKTITLNGENVNIYNTYDFPFDELKLRYEKNKEFETIGNGKRKYANCICSFDIETTTITKEECDIFKSDFGFMYIWQFCIEEYPVFGRTWEEYILFIHKLKKTLGITKQRRLVVFSHNLQFEFQFMRNFFKVEKVFAREKRNVVYAILENIEYRCSYVLTNMGLGKFLENTPGVKHSKLDGKKFDYRKKRFPDTELSNYEMAYSMFDVIGLVEGIRNHNIYNNDNLYTMPYTSTGYVRRDYKEVCLNTPGYKRQQLNIMLNERQYLLCKEASRGAISGSNRMWTDELLIDIDSHDIKSSYPYNMATKEFPQTKFIEMKYKYGDRFFELMDNSCCLITFTADNLKLKEWEGIPYISKAKCRAIEGAKCGNGKVYSAKRICMTCTEIDFRIIEKHYTMNTPVILELWSARKGLLARPFRKHLLEMFQHKTDLEDGDIYIYNKYKNKINASFGMMLTDIVSPEILYNETDDIPWKVKEITELGTELKKYYYNKNSFLSYQHGVWVLAHARDELMRGIDIVKNDVVQVDTDSVKNLGDYKVEFKKINNSIIEKAETFDIKPYAFNKKGEKVYLGIWENEHLKKDSHYYTYTNFRTLGAKKYAYTGEDNKIKITVAGLAKASNEYIDTVGGIDSFRNGLEIPPGKSGRTTSTYVDLKEPVTIKVLGHIITLGSNIGIQETSYTLGMTEEWVNMLLDGTINEETSIDTFGNYQDSTIEA